MCRCTVSALSTNMDLVCIIILAINAVIHAQEIPKENYWTGECNEGTNCRLELPLPCKVFHPIRLSKDLTSHPNWKLLEKSDNCGYSVSDRIIGGEKASLGQYPWIARIGYSVSLDEEEPIEVDSYECGGTIISERYVLTAAHCSSEVLQMTLFQVRLGEHNAKTDKDCSGGVCAPPVQDIDVEEAICHAQYNMSTNHHDICLLRLVTPIQFNDYVRPICLPTYDTLQNDEFEGSVVDVAGWGKMDIFTGVGSDVLMTLKVPIVSLQACSDIFSGSIEITQNQLCAGGVVGKDSCGGDSGGPLMKVVPIDGQPRYFLIGIVSFGVKRCANSEAPGIYIRVSKYLQWILDNIRG